MARTSKGSSNKTVIALIAAILLIIIGIGSLRIEKFLKQFQYSNLLNTYYSPTPVPGSAVNNSGNNTDAQLEKDVQDIENSLNKLDSEQNNIDQGFTNQPKNTRR